MKLKLLKISIYIILLILSASGLCLFISNNPPMKKQEQSVIVNSPAIAEYQQTEKIREIMSPSVFALDVRVFVSEKNPTTQTMKESFCEQGIGTAYTVSDKGYFGTNNHVIDQEKRKSGCLETLAKKRNVSIASLADIRFRVEYTLMGTNKVTFPVEITKTFPKIDLAIMTPIQKEKNNQKWIPVEFRAASPNIVNGVFVAGKGPMILPDEPVAMMGSPLNLPFTITNGKLGNNTFFEYGTMPFVHFIADINSGNSGGVLYSLLDFKFIGMPTMAKVDREIATSQAGAIPFWEIQKALKEVDMK